MARLLLSIIKTVSILIDVFNVDPIDNSERKSREITNGEIRCRHKFVTVGVGNYI
jgi:hypothetical protein